MTRLSLAARNTLVQDPAIRALVGKDVVWTDGWVFDGTLEGITHEGSQTCAVVLNQGGQYTTMNAHNTMRFPRLIVDIWADPTRHDSGAVKVKDADNKIEALADLIIKHFHTVDLGAPGGQFHRWGTAAQIANGTALTVLGSSLIDGLDISDISDTEGGRMGRLVFGVSVVG